MLASAEAPAAKRKNVRRERPLQPMGSTIGEVMIGKTPWCEGGLNKESHCARGRGDSSNVARVEAGETGSHISRYL